MIIFGCARKWEVSIEASLQRNFAWRQLVRKQSFFKRLGLVFRGVGLGSCSISDCFGTKYQYGFEVRDWYISNLGCALLERLPTYMPEVFQVTIIGDRHEIKNLSVIIQVITWCVRPLIRYWSYFVLLSFSKIKSFFFQSRLSCVYRSLKNR